MAHEQEIIMRDARLQKYIDESVAGTTWYIGYAQKGTLTSSAEWAIKRVTIVGTVTQITWADGDCNFDNVYDDRATLDY